MSDATDIPATPEAPARRKRSGGRSAHRDRAGYAAIQQRPWGPPCMTDPFVEPLPPEGVEAIHDTAMRILEEIGLDFLNEEALKLFREAGCKVDGPRVRMGRDWVMEMLARAPSSFTLTPRNPDRRVTIGDGHMNFVNVSSPPNFWDLTGGKRPGTRETCANLIKLSQYFNCIHIMGGYPVEPVDIHASVRHLDVLYDKLTLTDKVCHAYSLGTERIEDGMEMVRLAAGLDEDAFQATPHMYTNINSTSPLKHDQPMLDGALRCIRRGQALIVTPFTLAGAMAPVTLAGAVAQSIAEGLCVIALAQHVRPGSPCVLGTFTSNVDMKSGAPAFGTPEYMRATQMTGQMARFYGLPLRSSGVCAANVPDGQAMWETMASLWAAAQSGSHVVYHAAGWLEGGLIASPEKFVMDCEILQQISRYFDPALTSTDTDDLAFDTIAEVGTSGHFFGVQHTQDRYTTAFYQPFLSDWRNFEAWEADNGVWTAQRAHARYLEILADYQPPAIDPGCAEALRDFVARRKAEGGAPTDF